MDAGKGYPPLVLQPVPVGNKSLADYTQCAERSGKEHVRKHFLTPRLLRDWLNIFRQHR